MVEPRGEDESGGRGGIGLTAPAPWIVVLIAAEIFLVAAGLWMAVLGPADASGPDGTPPAPDRQRPATVESAWPMVEARARTWDSEARLFSVSAQYDWPANPDGDSAAPVGGWLTYVFVRPGGGEPESLSILVERNRAAIVRETAARWGTEVPRGPALSFTEAAIISSDALTAAERAGGSAFRDECHATRYVTRLTFRAGTVDAPPTWLMSYNDSRVRNGRAVTISVSATTGEATVTPFTGANPALDDLGECPA